MSKITNLLLIFLILISIASAAIISVYMHEERDIEVLPWATYEVNLGESQIYGREQVVDYYNVTNSRSESIMAEIHTELLFNGVVLDDTEGINFHYFMSDGFGDIQPAVDSNFNGYPDVTLWGTQTNDGITTIQRKVLTSTDLAPGIYTLNMTIVPRAVISP